VTTVQLTGEPRRGRFRAAGEGEVGAVISMNLLSGCDWVDAGKWQPKEGTEKRREFVDNRPPSVAAHS
jgi:hypothetical protein